MLGQTHQLEQTNTLAYYRVFIFIVQALGVNVPKKIFIDDKDIFLKNLNDLAYSKLNFQ